MARDLGNDARIFGRPARHVLPAPRHRHRRRRPRPDRRLRRNQNIPLRRPRTRRQRQSHRFRRQSHPLLVDVALSAAAIAGAAGVERAKVLARGEETTFSQQFAHQFSKEALNEAWHAPKAVIADNIEQYGRKEAENGILKGAVAKGILKGGVADFAEGAPGRQLSWAGLVVGGAGPAGNSEDISNAFGWRSVQHLPHATTDLLNRDPHAPDLQLKVQPTVSSPRVTGPSIGPERPTPSPVMGAE